MKNIKDINKCIFFLFFSIFLLLIIVNNYSRRWYYDANTGATRVEICFFKTSLGGINFIEAGAVKISKKIEASELNQNWKYGGWDQIPLTRNWAQGNAEFLAIAETRKYYTSINNEFIREELWGNLIKFLTGRQKRDEFQERFSKILDLYIKHPEISEEPRTSQPSAENMPTE